MNLWEGLFGEKLNIPPTTSLSSAPTSTAPNVSPEQAKLSWAQTKLFNILPLVLPDFKDQPKEKQIVVTKFLAQRPDIFAQVLATNVKGWKEFPVEKKRKIMSAIYSPEQMEALDKWPWFDPVFALSAPIGFGTKAIAQQAIKAGARAALKEAGKTAAASGASLAAETGMTLVGEPLEEKHPILASILAPLVGAGIGVGAEKGIGVLARKLSKPKIKEVAKEVGEKTTEELAEEVIEEATPSPSGQPKLKTKPQAGKGGLTLNLEQITKEAEEVASKVEPEIKSEIKISPEEAVKVFDKFPVNPYPAEKKIRFKNLKDVWNVYKEELLGKEIKTPLGFKFVPKEEDFFKIISGGRKKGLIEGFSLKEAIEKLEKGELSHSQIKGFQPVRAENLRLLEDVLKEPDLILESNKKPNRFVFIKQFQTKKGKRGFIGVLLNLENKETELISFHPKKLPNIKNRILKGEYKVKWAPHEEVPIPSRGEPGLHEGAGESIGPQETSSTSTVNKITQKTPFVKFEGEGWIIVPSEKGKFRIAFEDSELGQLVKDALYNQLEEVKAGEPPRLYRIEGGQGPIEYTRTRSTFPSWFKNKGWNKKRVISVLEKALKGESLTEKQAEIVKEALSSKEVKDYVKTVLSWGGEEVKLYAGIPLDEALQKGFKALNQFTQVAGEKAAKKGLYKVADVLGYGKELKGKDIKGIKTWTAKLYNLEDIVRRYGKDYPEVKEIEYAMKWIREPQANRWAHAVDESIMKPLGKLSNESKEKVFRALYRESLTGKPDLSIRKFTPQELNVYRRIRRFLEIVWKDVKNSYRDALAQYINAKPMSAEEKAILKRALIEANPKLVPEELKLKHSVFYRHLVRYSEMHPVPFYMPQKRTGNFMIKIIDPETKEVLFAHDVETSAEAKKIAEAFKKGDFSTIKNWFKELGVPFDPNAILKNCKVVAEEISRVPVEAGEEIPFSKTIAFLHAVAERAKNLPQEDVANFYMNMAEDLDNFLKSLGWSSHLIKRKNIPGFSLKVKDAEKRLRGYLYGYGLSKAKKQAMEHSYKAFYKLVHKKGYKPAGLIQELSNYLNYAFGTPERKEVQIANKAIVLWYLGGRIKSALINATQNFTSGLTAYIHHKIPSKQLFVGLKKVFKKEAQTLEDRMALRRAIKEGWLDANIVDEMLSQWRSMNTVIDTAMLPFRYVETYVNRATHFMGAFDYFLRVKKMPFEEAYKKAIEVMLEGHFWASRYNRAPFERGTWGRLLTALQTFTFHYFRYAFDLANKKEWKALAWLLGSPMVLGGIAAIPGGDLVKKHVLEPLYKKITGKDLEVDLSKHLGFKYGLAKYISPSISISVGVGFSEDPMRIYGGVVQNLWRQAKRSYELWERGDKWGAITELMPMALRDIFKAVRNKSKLKTTFGEIILDEKGKPVSLTGKEAFMMALGFKPMRVQKIYDMRTLEREIQAKRNEILRKFGTQFTKADTAEDKRALWRALKEYNDEVKQKMLEAKEKGDLVYYRYWKLMLISPDEVYRWAKLNQRAEKGIRKEIKSFAREIYQQ